MERTRRARNKRKMEVRKDKKGRKRRQAAKNTAERSTKLAGENAGHRVLYLRAWWSRCTGAVGQKDYG